jgi:hypothetical protein
MKLDSYYISLLSEKYNSLIHRELQREGIVSSNDQQTTVYVERKDMTGAERTFANSYRPNEDIIRYGSASKVHKVKAGDYARVINTDPETNKITVRLWNGRELTYNPTRLSGVSVYYEAERAFAEGDRLQIRAPFRAKRIANGALGTITKIEPDQIRLAMDSGREVTVDVRKFRHLDYGYAVTSQSSQGLTFDRVLINADTRQSVQLLNDRMAYVAVSRARYDALIYTDSTQNLSEALNREINKTTALEAVQGNEREVKKDRDELRLDPPAAQQPQLPFDHDIKRIPTHVEPAQTQAAPPAIESRNSIARATNETLIRTDSAQNLSESLNRSTSQPTALGATLDDNRELKKHRDKLTPDSLASQQQRPSEHNLNQAPTRPNPAPTKAAELEIEGPEIDLGLIR